MGRMQVDEMIEHGGRELALKWHLQSNHYPPVPLSMLPICEEAIELANMNKWDAFVELPNGVTYKGSTFAPVIEIVRQHHLESFLEDSNGEE